MSFILTKGVLQQQANRAGGKQYALEFDGEDDYVEMEKQYDFGTSINFSVCGWMYVDNYDEFGALFAQTSGSSGFWLGHNRDGGELRTRVGRNVKNLTDNPIEIKDWKFITATYDRDNNVITGYVDGDEKLIKALNSYDDFYEDIPAKLGTTSVNNFFAGMMKFVGIYERLLMQAEINDIKNGEIIKDGAVGLWTFKKGEGNTLYDESDYQNNGTIYGAKWVEL
ncbi:MAG: LamG domain-containing protein [Bacteroidales bacterium]